MTRSAVCSAVLAFSVVVAGCREDKPHSDVRIGDSAASVEITESSTRSPDSDSARAAHVGSDSTSPTTGPGEVVKRYYEAIQMGQYDSAYALWGQSGKASGQTRPQFASGFRQTRQAVVAITGTISTEGAAGSQYATVPVTVDAVLQDGTRQHFVGTYTLRRAMVDGATPAQRSWHIYSANLQQR